MFSKKSEKSVHALICEQIKDVEACLITFESFMHAATTPETVKETLRTLAANVCCAEDQADKSLRKMIDSLYGEFLPSTRESLISIATSCDKIANKCEGISKMIVFQKFIFPAEYKKDILDILSITHSQFEILEDSISMLFSDLNGLLKDHSILDKIRAYESDVDKIENKLADQIFDLDIGLAERRQLFDYIESLCDLSDVIEDIADKIQIMLITRKA